MAVENAYRVLARKYRPHSFADLIGQEPIVRTLSNAFKTGRIAQAYMLTGVRGVGKTTTARILARALNYKNDGKDEPSIDLTVEGEHCRAIMEGRHVDVIEMDAASHTGIDDIRDIIESVQYAPALARYKVYIIDEVHMLSRSAFNGLLKTLEEPPAHLKFIFATTEIRKVPVTVLSRCQRFDLRRIDAGTMVSHLEKVLNQEGVEAENEALGLIARASEGSVRDALSILDQAIAHASGKVEAGDVRGMLGLADRARVIDLFENVMGGDIAAALAAMQEQYDVGADPYVVLSDLADFTHFVTRLKFSSGDGPGSMLGETSALSETERSRGKDFADRLSVRVLGRAWQILLKGLQEIRDSERALAAAEMVLVRLTHAVDLPPSKELMEAVSGGKPAASSVAKSPAGSSSTERHGSVTRTTGILDGNAAEARRMQSPASSGGVSANHPEATGQSKADLPRTMAGRTQAAPDPNTREDIDPAEGRETRILANFDELIFLCEDKRDLKAKAYLKRHVRLVDFRDGYFEFKQVGDPPREALQYLKRCLEDWTGKRWNIVVSDKDGMPTIEEIENAEREARLQDARSHPAVAAILRTFEGARIVDVRIRGDDKEQLPPPPENDIDDFFE